MPTNFVALATTTPSMADALVYHLRQTTKRSSLEGTHVLITPAGAQVKVCISQNLASWIASMGS